MTTTEIIASIHTEIRRCSPNCSAFAYSMDRIDQFVADGIRKRMSRLATELVDAGAGDDVVKQAHTDLTEACKGDSWAEKEVAGRFLSCVRRMRITRAIARHPRAHRFDGLIRAIGRGRYSRKQWRLAQQLAREAAAA